MKRTASILLLALAINALHADLPFRQHRYDSWTVLQVPPHAIVFVGNSITDMHPWNEAFGGDPRIVNRGNSGALSIEVLENMDCWVKAKPDAVFLMIGTNDLGSGIAVEQVAQNIRAIVRRVRTESPHTRLFLQSILPARDQQLRTLATTCQANDSIWMIAQETPNTYYIDLYHPLLPIRDNRAFSYDRLHLTATGYQAWCQAIAPHVGLQHAYPASAPLLQHDGGLDGSNGMRATYFSLLPPKDGDILFFGDEMVKCGEWAELLHTSRIKNRGTGWGYGGCIATTRAMVAATLGKKQHKGLTCCLYTATDDVASDRNLALVELDYRQLAEQLLDLTPGSRLYVLGLMPASGDNTRIRAFNLWLKAFAEQNERIAYLDLHSLLADTLGQPSPLYIKDNYLYGKGYLQVAQALKSALGL